VLHRRSRRDVNSRLSMSQADLLFFGAQNEKILENFWQARKNEKENGIFSEQTNRFS
jgi:hypothetical protein